MMNTSVLKNLAYRWADQIGMNRIAAKIAWMGANILMYHGVVDDDERIPCWWQIKKGLFEKQIRYLKKHFTMLTMDELTQSLRDGTSLPPSSMVLTFDDGYRNYLTHALPVLKHYNVPSILYVPTGPVQDGTLIWSDQLYIDLYHHLTCDMLRGSKRGLVRHTSIQHRVMASIIDLKEMSDYERVTAIREMYDVTHMVMNRSERTSFSLLSEREIRSLAGEPLVEIGSHAVSHKPLTSLTMDCVNDELMCSKAFLERIIARDVKHFCYPAGYCDDTTVRAVENAGYISAVLAGGEKWGTDKLHAIPRVGVGGNDSRSFFRCQASGLISLKNWLCRYGLQ